MTASSAFLTEVCERSKCSSGVGAAVINAAHKRGNQGKEKLPYPKTEVQARDQAGKAAGVSGRYVDTAIFLTASHLCFCYTEVCSERAPPDGGKGQSRRDRGCWRA